MRCRSLISEMDAGRDDLGLDMVVLSGWVVAYSLDLPIVAGSVLTDGTSDIDGVNSLVS